MIKDRTVFILGAGASAPYGYPVGKDLRKEIISHYPGDCQHYLERKARVKSLIPQEVAKARRFAEMFDKSGTESIDLFLAINPEFMQDGKRAIIFRILIAEGRSRFREAMEEPNQDWYTYLLKKLTEGLTKKDDYKHFCENNVAFITFNYDRSLEHFMYDALINRFNGIDPGEIRKQIGELPVIHIFGQVAGLDWQDMPSKIEYRRDVGLIDVEKLIEGLHIVHEEGQEGPELLEARRLIADAEHIFFLGIGYAEENLKVLKVPEGISVNTKVYGTVRGLRDNEIERIRMRFEGGTVGDAVMGKNAARFREGFKDGSRDCLLLLRDWV